jgi:hypothetical protein
MRRGPSFWKHADESERAQSNHPDASERRPQKSPWGAEPQVNLSTLVERASTAPQRLTARDVHELQRLAGNRATSQLVTDSLRSQPQRRTAPSEPVVVRTERAVVQRMAISALWINQVPLGQREDYAKIIGDAKNTEDLPEDRLVRLIDLFNSTNSSLLKDKAATLSAEIERKNTASAPQGKVKKELHPLEREALKTLGEGESWKALKPAIDEWKSRLKQFEKADTFEAAFKDRRMTGRQINTAGRGGDFDVRRVHGGVDRKMKLARDVPSIRTRMNPTNFYNSGKSSKNRLGLHDLSASLLNPATNISHQLKHYQDAVVLFMPVPPEDDLRILAALAKLDDRDEAEIRQLKSEITRLKLAQSSDMGTVYVDVSTGRFAPGKFRYGITGTIIRAKGTTGQDATAEELAARRTNALKYKSILDDDLASVNEVVIAYRKHESSLFPMFGKWDGSSGYNVVNDALKPSGHYISDKGEYR